MTARFWTVVAAAVCASAARAGHGDDSCLSNVLKGRRKEQSAVQCFLRTVTGNSAVPLP